MLLIREGFNRILLCCLQRRIERSNDAAQHGEDRSLQDPADRDLYHQSWEDRLQQSFNQETRSYSEDNTQDANERCLLEDQTDDKGLRSAQ
jgi:hypothetical protein